MNELVFTLLVLGCSHNLDVCREVSSEPVVYQSIEACEDSAKPAARSVEDFPMAVVQCLPVKVSAANSLDEADWYFAADGTLQLAIPADANDVANNEVLPVAAPVSVAENSNG